MTNYIADVKKLFVLTLMIILFQHCGFLCVDQGTARVHFVALSLLKYKMVLSLINYFSPSSGEFIKQSLPSIHG